MNAIRAFGRFWYDFIIGDDWKIPLAVVIALAVVAVLMTVTDLSDAGLTTLGAVLVVAAFSTSIAIDVRRAR